MKKNQKFLQGFLSATIISSGLFFSGMVQQVKAETQCKTAGGSCYASSSDSGAFSCETRLNEVTRTDLDCAGQGTCCVPEGTPPYNGPMYPAPQPGSGTTTPNTNATQTGTTPATQTTTTGAVPAGSGATTSTGATDECKAAHPTFQCTDINGSNNIFNASKACVTGLCEGASNIQCCRTGCDSGESCQTPAAGLTCVGRGVCSGSRQCCKAAGSASGTTGSTGAAGTQGNNVNSNASGSTTFTNPLKFNTVESFLDTILSAIQKIIVTLALIAIVYGGLLYITAGAVPENVKKGKEAMTMALTGLAIGIAAPSLLKELGSVIGWNGVNSSVVGGALTLTEIAMKVLNFLLSIAGILSLIMLVLGAILYLSSAGDKERLDQGKKMFKYSLGGVIVAMSAMIAVQQVANFFVNSNTPAQSNQAVPTNGTQVLPTQGQPGGGI